MRIGAEILDSAGKSLSGQGHVLEVGTPELSHLLTGPYIFWYLELTHCCRMAGLPATFQRGVGNIAWKMKLGKTEKAWLYYN